MAVGRRTQGHLLGRLLGPGAADAVIGALPGPPRAVHFRPAGEGRVTMHATWSDGPRLVMTFEAGRVNYDWIGGPGAALYPDLCRMMPDALRSLGIRRMTADLGGAEALREYVFRLGNWHDQPDGTIEWKL